MRRRVIVTVVLGLLLASPAARAEDGADTRNDTGSGLPTGIPQLNGHRFVPSPLVPSAFVRSSLRNVLNVGSTGTIETEPIVIGGNEIPGLAGTVSLATLELEYQVALKRWLALHGRFGLGAQFGTGVQTLLSEGLSSTTIFEVGWVFGLHEREKTALAAGISISNRSVTVMSVYNLVNDIIEGSTYGLSQTTPVLNALADVRWSWAPSELFGLSLVASVGNGETLDRSQSTDWFYRGGIAVGFDLDKYDWPMAVTLAGSGDNFGGALAAERKATGKGGIIVSYIGRDAFVFSLEYQNARIPTTGTLDTVDVSTLGFSIQYYF